MTNAIAKANANAAIINTDSTSTVNAADAANKDLAGVMMAMPQRIEALAVEREAWELTASARSNELLYGVMQKCYALYNDLTQRTGDVGARKMALQDYINGKGLAFKPDIPRNTLHLMPCCSSFKAPATLLKVLWMV